MVAGADTAGFSDHSEYEEAKKQGSDGIKRMILKNLKNTSVTVILIGTEAASRPWVKYEIAQSIAQKRGCLVSIFTISKTKIATPRCFAAQNRQCPSVLNFLLTIGTNT